MSETASITLLASAIVATITMIPVTAFSSSNSENMEREEHPLSHVRNRGPINHNFDPDESCNLNAYQLKCIPGSEQDCPDGYHNGEDNLCSPVECQEGYHGAQLSRKLLKTMNI